MILMRNARVPMRDGTLLATDIYRPVTNRKVPVLVARTPYNKDGMHGQPEILDVCHASELGIIKIPDWQYRNPDPRKKPEKKDFGIGFYMCKTQDKSYPIGLKSGYQSVFLNEYKLDLSGLCKLELKVNLLWVMVVAAHRQRKSGSGVAIQIG